MACRSVVRRAGLALFVAVAACSSPKAPPRPAPAAPAPRPFVPGPVVSTPVPAPKPPQKPTWTARKVVADADEVQAQTVTVAAGDSLARIAARTGASIGAIAAANGLTPPYVLVPGRTLQVPAGRYHRVKDGETGIAIARAYGVSWDSVITSNRLAAPYNLRVGERLLLPTKRAVAAMTLEQRAKAFKLDIDDLITGSEPASRKPPTPAKPTAKPAPQTAQAPAKPIAEPATFNGRFVWPVTGRILSVFGPKPGGRYNDGINIQTPAGTPVKAAADGVVAYAGSGIEGFGGLVLIKHGDGLVTAYAHNESLAVARGDTVTRGQVIAKSGATGSVEEPQLHFEIRRGRTPIDPVKMLGAQK